ncbi:MAG TPA: hypothetical protein VI702_01895, partial [Nitrospiria bacterium]
MQKVGRLLGLLLALFLSAAQVAPAAASDTTPRYVPGEVLVKFKPGTTPEEIGRIHAKLKSQKKAELRGIGAHRVKIAPGLSVEEAIGQYQQDPNVLYAEPNYIRRLFATTPSDALFDQQWGLHNTGQLIIAGPG